MLNQTLELLPLEDQLSNLIYAAERVNENAGPMPLHPGTKSLYLSSFFIKLTQQVDKEIDVFCLKGTVFQKDINSKNYNTKLKAKTPTGLKDFHYHLRNTVITRHLGLF